MRNAYRCLAILIVLLTVFGSICSAKEELTLWLDPRPAKLEWAKPIVNAFMAENPDIEVKIVTGWVSAFEVASLGGAAPDVVIYAGDYVPGWVADGLLMPLDKYFDKDFNTTGYVPIFDSLRVKGSLYGIPVSWVSYGLQFNADLFDQAGVAYPNKNWTWEDLLKAARKLTVTKPGENVPYQWGIGQNWNANKYYLPFIWSAGGSLWNSDFTKCVSNSPEVEQGLQFYYDLFYTHRVNPTNDIISEGTLNQGGPLLEGRIAMRIASPNMSLTNNEGFRYGIAELPKGPSGGYGTVLIIDSVQIHSMTKKPDLAWKLAKFIASDKGLSIGYAASATGMQYSPITRMALEKLQNSPYLYKENLLALASHATLPVTSHPWLGIGALPSLEPAVKESIPIRTLLEQRAEQANREIADAISAGTKW